MTTLQLVTLVTAISGAACGVLGAVLGIINTWNQLRKSRVRVRVLPKIAWVDEHGVAIIGDRPSWLANDFVKRGVPGRLCIEVLNLSEFPVTVSDVGFGSVKGDHVSMLNMELSPSKTWPVRLESREAVTAFAPVKHGLDPAKVRKPRVYACTDCGHVVYGSSPIFKQYLGQLRQASESKK